MSVILELLHSNRSIIALNGTINQRLFTLVNVAVPLIAADGAANQLLSFGFMPDYVVGDHDSCCDCMSSNYILMKDQDSTDFEKCVQFATAKQMIPSLVIGFNGGEIDHILGNMQTFVKHGHHKNLYGIDAYMRPQSHTLGIKLVIPLIEESIRLHLKPQSLLSLIPFGLAQVSTFGLCWELDNALLESSVNASMRNCTIDEDVEICVHTGAIMLIVDYTIV